MNLIEKAKKVFRKCGGIMRTHEIQASGIHPRTLYTMRDDGSLECISRGVYRLSELPPLVDPDLARVAMRVPNAVVCLISALAFHELTTEIPHAVHIALPRRARYPTIEYPPIRVYLYSNASFNAGIEEKRIDGVATRVFCAEKTLADCFKFRNKIGMDVVLEALHTYRLRRGARIQRVLEFARVCRVEKVIRPYLEVIASM